ncbi:putative aaa family atpase protein [Botrytis fragariae]|uniref:Putative aaa family atpase protein n=1 Tax=Botrytis fragariae TaxID=1964551 RepID=A0A8H6EPK5_9HELO|nr:putative aaa family atpase protein [Botrytis fragariae]KAF5879525.1 putative aaa family atpase protein [Botrytis fragariae]
MSLYYPELTKKQNKQFFKLNLELTKNHFNTQNRKPTFNDSIIINFAELHFDNHKHARWNGRQIRSAPQTALALAEYDVLSKSLSAELNNSVQMLLKQDHFIIIQSAYLDFSKYLGDVFGTDGDGRAEGNRLRARSEKNAEYPSKLMQRAAEKSQTSLRGHRNEILGHDIAGMSFSSRTSTLVVLMKIVSICLLSKVFHFTISPSIHLQYMVKLVSLKSNKRIKLILNQQDYNSPTYPLPQPMTIHDSRGQPMSYP